MRRLSNCLLGLAALALGCNEPTDVDTIEQAATASDLYAPNSPELAAARKQCAPCTAECDLRKKTKCETNTCTDVHNCGGCNVVCSVANGTPTCSSGTCAVGACHSGFGDCDHNAANGCETSLTNNNNCGACGTVCASGTSCQSGQCVPSCGTVDCGFGPVDTCSDNFNCGGCGAFCPATCIGGTCP